VSEIPYKRRVRDRKRIITSTLEAQGYKVRSFDNGPFHLLACRGGSARAIRIEFGYTDINIVDLMSHEPVPVRCQREIWQVSADGRVMVVAKISASLK
jgi:tryptophan synthase beta subunit